MEHVFESLRLFARHPRLWRYAIQPLAVATLVFVLLIEAGYALIVPRLTALLSVWSPGGLASFVSNLAYATAWFFLAGVVFIALASFCSSMMWDKLSSEIEEVMTGAVVRAEPPQAEIWVDSAVRMILALTLAVSSLCLGLVVPVVGPLAIAALVGLLDYTASAFVRRNMLLGSQRRNLRKLKGWAGFGIVAGVITLIPVVNLLMLPIMVGAGTVMVVRSGISPRAIPPQLG